MKKKKSTKRRVIPARAVIPAKAGIQKKNLKHKVLRAAPAPLSEVGATVIGKLPTGWTAKKVAVLATLTANAHGFRGKGVVSVKIVGDAEIRKLNKMYRDKDKTTDVLSFGYTSRNISHSAAPVIPAPVIASAAKQSQVPIELGDIVISLPQVRRQAAAIGRDVSAEFALMIVHGVLHILGHDHVTLAQETRMFSLQHETLLRSGWF